nr:ribonuclease H-like domain-containing protein [Tanacetum cinerariifolium]
MHDPQDPCFSALKRILRYVRGTLNYGLQLFSSSTTYLVAYSELDYGLQLFSSSTTYLDAYSDADWAGCPTSRRSTSEADYRGVANAIAETCLLRNLLRELHTLLSSPTLIYYDNVVGICDLINIINTLIIRVRSG